MPLRAQGVIELASWENEGGPSPPTAQHDERLDWASLPRTLLPPRAKSRLRVARRIHRVSKASGTDVADVRSVVTSSRMDRRFEINEALERRDNNEQAERPHRARACDAEAVAGVLPAAGNDRLVRGVVRPWRRISSDSERSRSSRSALSPGSDGLGQP